MAYVAMFDEVDEGTDFKCNDTPVSIRASSSLKGLPVTLSSTHCNGAKLLRGESPVTDAVPVTAATATSSSPGDDGCRLAVGQQGRGWETGGGMKDALTQYLGAPPAADEEGGLARRPHERGQLSRVAIVDGRAACAAVRLQRRGRKMRFVAGRAGFAENPDKFVPDD
jgi:hypothetical protein